MFPVCFSLLKMLPQEDMHPIIEMDFSNVQGITVWSCQTLQENSMLTSLSGKAQRNSLATYLYLPGSTAFLHTKLVWASFEKIRSSLYGLHIICLFSGFICKSAENPNFDCTHVCTCKVSITKITLVKQNIENFSNLLDENLAKGG